jgi:hypothetical protein
MNFGEMFGGVSRRSAVLIGLTIGFGFLHHIDHVLRVDHSGWPFRPEVNPFTFSLLAYLILLFALFGPRRLFWLRWVLLLLGVAFTIFAHTVLETPRCSTRCGLTTTAAIHRTTARTICLGSNLKPLGRQPSSFR